MTNKNQTWLAASLTVAYICGAAFRTFVLKIARIHSINRLPISITISCGVTTLIFQNWMKVICRSIVLSYCNVLQGIWLFSGLKVLNSKSLAIIFICKTKYCIFTCTCRTLHPVLNTTSPFLVRWLSVKQTFQMLREETCRQVDWYSSEQIF